METNFQCGARSKTTSGKEVWSNWQAPYYPKHIYAISFATNYLFDSRYYDLKQEQYLFLYRYFALGLRNYNDSKTLYNP